jgi:lipopolysaccharide export system protein LptA
MKSKVAWPLALCLVALPLGGLVVAQTPQTTVPVTPEKDGVVTIRNSPQGKAVYDDQRGIARITKDVRVTQAGEDFILYADDVTYNRTKNQAIATGNIRVETRDSTIRGTSIFADFDTKIISITGNVTMSSHGEKDGIVNGRRGFRDEVTHKPSNLVCKRIDWNYENRQAVITGDIRMIQGANVGTCNRIRFDERQNIAFLEGNVIFEDREKERTMRTSELTIYIDENQIQTSKSTVVVMKPDNATKSATPRPTSAPAFTFEPKERIGDDVLNQFNVTPAATPRPEKTEAAPAEHPTSTPSAPR